MVLELDMVIGYYEKFGLFYLVDVNFVVWSFLYLLDLVKKLYVVIKVKDELDLVIKDELDMIFLLDVNFEVFFSSDFVKVELI